MQAARFPGFAEHHKQHEALTQQVEEFIQEVKSGKMALSVRISKFLKLWLDHHILGSDQKYAKHCRTLNAVSPHLAAIR
jgi:hemerythrin